MSTLEITLGTVLGNTQKPIWETSRIHPRNTLENNLGTILVKKQMSTIKNTVNNLGNNLGTILGDTQNGNNLLTYKGTHKKHSWEHKMNNQRQLRKEQY